jgi:isoquinoline 1-oxidoreductase beta subunit
MLGADAKGYDVAHQLVEQAYEDTGMRTAPLRGIGFTANKFATETFVDEIAHKQGVDPVAYRLDLLTKTPRAHKVMERVAQMADWGRKREGLGLGAAYIDYSGTQIATIVEIALDRRTGKIKFHNVWCAIDCGVAVQPDNVVAQTESSIVYGIGLALTERISMRDGAVEQSNFYDYIVARNRDVPQLHVEVIQTENHPTGVGQMATPTITPAVSNAVMALAGVRLRHAPFTEERVKKALG